jgi:predicted regulator of Ras-like GTPase activity (Roadblock/LC7/MglB family)
MAHIEVPHPGAAEIVGRLLSEALSEHPDVQWLGLVSEDGFAIASEGVADVNEDAVAAGAVRMMIQVRAMSKALGQTGTSQMFMEGSDSGICVIDKDPWVLIMVGAPGVPIGLLRYEAREIAEAFPVNRRAELPSEPMVTEVLEEEQPQWWAASVIPESEDDLTVPDPAVETEIRWADEPTTDDASGVDEFTQATDFQVVEPDEAFALADAVPVAEDEPVVVEEEIVTFDLAPADDSDEVGFELAPPVTEEVPSFDLAAPVDDEPVSFDLAAPAFGEEPAMAAGFAVEDDDDLFDLAPPTGEAIDLPPPSGPAFQLPPPV